MGRDACRGRNRGTEHPTQSRAHTQFIQPASILATPACTSQRQVKLTYITYTARMGTNTKQKTNGQWHAQNKASCKKQTHRQPPLQEAHPELKEPNFKLHAARACTIGRCEQTSSGLAAWPITKATLQAP